MKYKFLKKMLGKKLIWTGTEVDDEKGAIVYLLFEDGLCFCMSELSGEILEVPNYVEVLTIFCQVELDKAEEIMSLRDLLVKLNAPKEIEPPKEIEDGSGITTNPTETAGHAEPTGDAGSAGEEVGAPVDSQPVEGQEVPS